MIPGGVLNEPEVAVNDPGVGLNDPVGWFGFDPPTTSKLSRALEPLICGPTAVYTSKKVSRFRLPPNAFLNHQIRN